MALGRKTGGRQKGAQNKMTVELKTAIERAFRKVGGHEYLVKVAESDPTVFCQLLGKLLPLQHTGAEGGPIEVSWLPPPAA